MKQYFFKISMTYQDKNPIYKGLREYAQSLDAYLLNGPDQLKAFKGLLKDKLEELKKKHSRCKKFRLDFFDHLNKGEEIYVHGGSWTANIYLVQQVL